MRPPDFVIGKPEDPYMFRWFVIPRNRFFNVYLHKFLRDDDDRALHDHPWWFISIVLKGTYREVLRDTERCVKCGNDTWQDDGRSAHLERWSDQETGRGSNCPACGAPLFIATSWRKRFIPALRSATHRHRVVLKRDPDTNKPIPCWTLVLTGPVIRTWGFWCPKGFVSWKEFTKPGNKGEVGPGCGD